MKTLFLSLAVVVLSSFRPASPTVYVVASSIGDKYAYFSNVITGDASKCKENGPYSTGYSGNKYDCSDYYGDALNDQIVLDYSESKYERRRLEVKTFDSYSTASDYRRKTMANLKEAGHTIRTVVVL